MPQEQVECPLPGSVFNVTTGKASESRRVVHESVLAKGEVGTEPDS
jgi:nitrite reductase/ring-hydroxylating ferredoxin subunit